MNRDYVGWYKLKSEIERRPAQERFHQREIWWCSFGANIGFEEDGKNSQFERAVLIIRKFNKELFLGVPLTTKRKDNRFYHPITIGDQLGSVMVSQVRVLSSRRLGRKLTRIGKKSFHDICASIGELLPLEKSIPADESAGSPVPSGNLYSKDSKLDVESQGREVQ